MSFTKEDEEVRGQDSVPYHVSIALISGVWGTRDTRRGGDRLCTALLQHQSHMFFKHIFPPESFCGQQKCHLWERVCGRAGGAGEHGDSREESKAGGMEREHMQREKHCKKQCFLFILAQQCLQHGLACLLLLNKYCDSSNPSEQGRNQNLDFH